MLSRSEMDAMRNSSRSSAATDHRTDQDHTVSATLSKKHYKKYEKSPTQTDYLEFAGRPHLMMTTEKWAEIAGAIRRLDRRRAREDGRGGQASA
jgi:transposase